MSDKSKDSENKLKELQKKELPKNVKKSVEEKLKYVNKPFSK